MFVKDLKNFNLPETEKKVLDFWQANQIFEKSVSLRRVRQAHRKQAQGKRRFVFYEGPPTANGRPGIHHVLARSFKDIILRYKTMAGFFAPRRGGWDTHGLPVEIEVEKELGLKSKKDIEKFGIAEFNRKCKESVWKYKEEWERLTERMGFWLDLKNSYITYESSYIETLWWIIKEVWKKKLLYKGHKVVHWCPRCGTGLSSHELAQGYKEITDNSVYVKFKLTKQSAKRLGQGDKPVYVLSWTTTPWTLPGNVALAVGEKIEYVSVLKNGEELWYAADSPLAKELGHTGKRIKGKNLVGLEYEPLFKIPALANKNSHKIYAADFVTTDEGTGVVHTAVMYGEDDYELGKKVGLPQHHTVDEQGKFTSEVPGLAGLFVKSKEAEEKIFRHLEAKSYKLKAEPYTHEYPFCWRCETPVLYYARTSWFVAMSKLRAQLLKNNKAINWIPAHLKDGRFGEWLKEAKDWNFSRERYWGTPLPVWECVSCKKEEVIGSLEEFGKKMGGARNNYLLMRHGEAESQIKHVLDSGQGEYHLTLRGRSQVEQIAKKLKKEKIDIIVSSDILRTKETAEIAAHVLGVEKIIFESRLREINLAGLSGCHSKDYHARFPTYESRFEKGPEKGESLRDVRARVWEVFEELEHKYSGKNILIVSHEYPIWVIVQSVEGFSEREVINLKKEQDSKKEDFFRVSEVKKLDFKAGPRNETGEVDLHRPYVDSLVFPCEACGKKMCRVKEVIDAWFDSGGMPFASANIPYPADYISEAVDQTRGWFYTLLAVGTLLGKGAPYKNVISLGHVNDKYGNKMSKSKGNVVDPWAMIEKYGVDAVRWYFFTATPPGEPKNFDEAEIGKAFRKFHLILWNSLVFYKTYAAPHLKATSYKLKPVHILDKWILARLAETTSEATGHLDKYEVREATLALEEFVDDLSRWYIRRSRRRFQKPENKKDFTAASATLGYALGAVAKLAAPFTPFFSEILWNELGGKESVHLVNWPRVDPSTKLRASKKLLRTMIEVRLIASAALAKRAEAGIRVRQPLRRLTVKSKGVGRELALILAQEVNVKEVMWNPKLNPPAGGELELDTAITPELKEEGMVREVVRMVQDLRQKAGFEPKDKIILITELPENLKRIFKKNEKFVKEEVGAKVVEYKKSSKFKAEIATKFDEADIWIGVRKA